MADQSSIFASFASQWHEKSELAQRLAGQMVPIDWRRFVTHTDVGCWSSQFSAKLAISVLDGDAVTKRWAHFDRPVRNKNRDQLAE